MWNNTIVIVQADIRKAFDSMRHEVIHQSLEEFGAPARLIHAFLQEPTETDIYLHLQQVLGASPV